MNKRYLSITLPAIRSYNWDALYESAYKACKKYTFEFIFCGPVPLTDKLQKASNVKYVKDFGSPTRASNIACSLAEGHVITWVADDCELIEDSLDLNLDQLHSMGDNYKNVVSQKYFENNADMLDSYLVINNSRNGSPYFHSSWVAFNNPLMYRKFYEELGGLDAFFDACPTAHNDLAVRAQYLGARVQISKYPFLRCGWMEGGTGDHQAIYLSQEQIDEPKFRTKYHNPKWNLNNLNIPLDNWKLSDNIWKVRFQNKLPTTYEEIINMNYEASL